jgi:hypothetical protein
VLARIPPRAVARIQIVTGSTNVEAQLVAFLGAHLPPRLAPLAALFTPLLPRLGRQITRRKTLALMETGRRRRILPLRRECRRAQKHRQEKAGSFFHKQIVEPRGSRHRPRL